MNNSIWTNNDNESRQQTRICILCIYGSRHAVRSTNSRQRTRCMWWCCVWDSLIIVRYSSPNHPIHVNTRLRIMKMAHAYYRRDMYLAWARVVVTTKKKMKMNEITDSELHRTANNYKQSIMMLMMRKFAIWFGWTRVRCHNVLYKAAMHLSY